MGLDSRKTPESLELSQGSVLCLSFGLLIDLITITDEPKVDILLRPQLEQDWLTLSQSHSEVKCLRKGCEWFTLGKNITSGSKGHRYLEKSLPLISLWTYTEVMESKSPLLLGNANLDDFGVHMFLIEEMMLWTLWCVFLSTEPFWNKWKYHPSKKACYAKFIKMGQIFCLKFCAKCFSVTSI